MEELDFVVWKHPKSNAISHTVKDMFDFAEWVSNPDNFDGHMNIPKTRMLYFDKKNDNFSLLIEELYTVWYTNHYKKE